MSSTWFLIGGMAVLLWLVLVFLTPLPKAGRLPVAAAITLGLAGYSWQGSPDLPGASVVKPVNMQGFGEVIDRPLAGLTDAYGAPARLIALSDALERQGNSASAARLLYGGSIRHPDSADIWVGYGNALANAAEGVVTPAAVMAFEKARVLDPNHSGPPLYLGLAAAQREDWATARREWEGLLERTSPQAPWRADLESRLNMLDQVQASEVPASPNSK